MRLKKLRFKKNCRLDTYFTHCVFSRYVSQPKSTDNTFSEVIQENLFSDFFIKSFVIFALYRYLKIQGDIVTNIKFCSCKYLHFRCLYIIDIYLPTLKRPNFSTLSPDQEPHIECGAGSRRRSKCGSRSETLFLTQ